jgi:diaminopimelate decarboxylase
VSLAAIAAAEGTPVYVYSAAALRERYRAVDAAFGAYPHAVHYALTANSTLAIARLLRELGSAADANTVWEIDVARKAGFAPSDIVFTGVGKSPAELEAAVALGVKAINVESAGELARVEAIAERLGKPTRVAIRINPDIDAKSHPHISTGLKINKFGVPLEDAQALFASFPQRPALRLVAVHLHVGSQITTLEPLRRAAALAAKVSKSLQAQGVALEYVDLGGGLGVSYDGKDAPDVADYVRALVDEIRPTGLPIVVEPGRAIAAPAGVLLARVLDVKPRTADSEFAIIDAGMTELMRPALYGAFHRIEPVNAPTEGAAEAAPYVRDADGTAEAVPNGSRERSYEIVGPVCESSDVVGRDRTLPQLHVGDLLAIRDAGAYGSAMASNYNRRPMPAEVMVDHGGWRLVRRRQTIDDMLSLES